MQEDEFSKKWGIVPEHIHEKQQSMWILVIGQLVVVMLILCIVRPSFVLESDSSLKVPEVSLTRVLVVSILVVIITYFYPFIAASFV